MHILISNDDGIFAPGIAALVGAFSAAGHTVYVCAPDAQRSAASHALSLGKPLAVRETALEGAARAYAIGGTPVDCVKLGIKVLCPQAEFVISGVNHGYNAGSDVLYSGTVGAAMEGVICGVPAMAVSLAYSREDTYDKAAALAVRLFDGLSAHPLASGTLLNLNYPAADEAKGVVATGFKKLYYEETYERTVSPQGEVCYALRGEIDETMDMADDDYSWLRRGYATATVISYDMTEYEATENLKNWL